MKSTLLPCVKCAACPSEDAVLWRGCLKGLGYLLFLVLAITSAAMGQVDKKNELGFVLGGAGIPNTTTSGGGQLAYGASVTYSIDYARQLFTGNHSLSLEFPLAASPSHSVEGEARDGFPPPSNSITSLATLFVTPSFRLRLFDHARLSPWISGGFGYGLFEGSDLLRNGAPNPQIHKNTGTAQFGGGLDIHTPLKLWFPINLRAEVRDYYTLDSPSFVGLKGDVAQHHLVGAGGFVLRF